MTIIAVFCGAREAVSSVFYEAATAIGQTLAHRHHAILYGGSTTGLMGAVADAALDEGGHVIGVCPQALASLEPQHSRLSRVIKVNDITVRKTVLAQQADAYLAIPGGFGTLDELFHVWTTARMEATPNQPPKPIALLNTDGFYDTLVAFLQQSLINQGFANQKALDHCLISADPVTLITQIEKHLPIN